MLNFTESPLIAINRVHAIPTVSPLLTVSSSNPKHLRANGTRDTARCMLINVTCICPCNRNTAYETPSCIDPLESSQRLDRVIRRRGRGGPANGRDGNRMKATGGERENHLGNHLTSALLPQRPSNLFLVVFRGCSVLFGRVRSCASTRVNSGVHESRSLRAHRNNVGRLISPPFDYFCRFASISTRAICTCFVTRYDINNRIFYTSLRMCACV